MTPDLTTPGPATPPRPSGRTFGLGTVVLATMLGAVLGTAGALLAVRSFTAAPQIAVQRADAPTLYQCPMHPSVVRDHPGNCPICGMKLVKVGQGGAKPPKDSTSGVRGLATVQIDPARQQLIGLKIVEVAQGAVGGAWRTVGRVAIDETRVRHINLKVPGFVERISVDFVGKQVRRGDPLFSIYSPELLSAQEEFLLALRTKDALARAGAAVANDGAALVAAACRKLALWDVPQSEIDRVARTGQPTKTLTFYSPISGVVTKKDVVEGMKLDAGAMPYEIVDLSSLWVLADVYESELRFVKENMAATLRLNAFPNREFRGKVVFIDPLFDPSTRTVKVRLTFPNPTGELRPEMFGEVILHGTSRDALRIPPDAIIDSGTGTLVFVAVGEGKFQPRKIRVGDSDGSYTEVVSGLALGERVVSRANFLIDSESRLRASLAELSSEASSVESQERARVLPAPSELSPAAPGSPMAPAPAAPSPPADERRGPEP